MKLNRSYELLALLLAISGCCLTTARSQSVPSAQPTSEPTIQLSPFEVAAEKELGYAASTAMAGTRTNEKLENLPNSISVMTQEFMQDLAFNNYFDAVDFATNTENEYNAQGTVGAATGNRSGNQVNIRGLASIRQLRDGFPWYLAADVFNTERIEFSRGPGGLAYGDVDAGGIINISSKRATFQQRGSTQVRYDNFGTQRYSIDFNQPLIPHRLGLRVNAINSEIEQFQQRMGRDLEGYAAALRWEPFKHRRTQIDVAYETGNTTYHLGHLGVGDSRAAYVLGTGTSDLDADTNRPGVQVHGVGMQQIRAANSATHAFVDIDGVINNWQSTAAHTFRLSYTTEGANAVNVSDPRNPLRIPLQKIPESIVPRGQDWGGPDTKQNSKYYAYTVELKHSFNERLNLLVAHNGQVDDTVRKQAYSSLGGMGGVSGRSIHIDVNPVLPNPNGPGTIPNPNYEQYYTVYTPFYNPDGHRIVNWRAQVVYDADLPLGVTQRIVGGVGYRHEKYYVDNFSYSLTKEEIAKRGFTGTAAYYTNNLVYPVHYLKDGNSDEKLGWNVRPGITQLFRSSAGGDNRRLDQSLTSGSVTLLGGYFKNRVRTSIGISREHWVQDASLETMPDPVTNEQRFVAADGSLIPNDDTRWISAPLYSFADEWSTNHTYGAVWHLMPWLSVTAGYFESSQFSDNYGLDLTGAARAPLTGEGHDFSARFHLLRGKIEASVTRFETRQENLNSGVSSVVRDELNPLLAQPFVNLTDYRDRNSTGWEYQVLTNITRQWTLLATYANNTSEFTRYYPLLGKLLAEARATAEARGLNPDDATLETRQYLAEQEGSITANRRATASVTTRYTFTEGRLKGFTVGIAARYLRGKPRASVEIAGVEVLPATTTDDAILTNPFVSYRRKFGRFTATLQLNINNVFDVQSDQGNTWRAARYLEPRQFVTTATLAF